MCVTIMQECYYVVTIIYYTEPVAIGYHYKQLATQCCYDQLA